MKKASVVLALAALAQAAQPLTGQLVQAPVPTVTLASRIAHTDPALYRVSQSVHNGAGPMNYMRLFNNTPGSVETNFQFVSRGLIMPHGGIGQHFHNTVEEMFIILDGEAEFTINGRTSRIKGPAGAPNVLGSSHAVYNPGDTPINWMNINVTAVKGAYDTFDLGDPRNAGVTLDPIPQFMAMRLYREMLQPVNNMNGGVGTVQYRRALGPSVFKTPWSYVDHVLLPPGTSIGAHSHTYVGEFVYVMAGSGLLKVGNESAPFKNGDGIPLHLRETHSIENNGTEPMELMIVGIAVDMTKNLETVNASAGGGRGGRGGGGGSQ